MIRVLRCCCVANALMFASAAVSPAAGQDSADVARVRAELDRLYVVNAEAFERGDVRALMELRAGDTAVAVIWQFLDRLAPRPDNQVHHVQTWVTQRETWLRQRSRWLLWRVDRVRNQRRLVDGKPG